MTPTSKIFDCTCARHWNARFQLWRVLIRDCNAEKFDKILKLVKSLFLTVQHFRRCKGISPQKLRYLDETQNALPSVRLRDFYIICGYGGRGVAVRVPGIPTALKWIRPESELRLKAETRPLVQCEWNMLGISRDLDINTNSASFRFDLILTSSSARIENRLFLHLTPLVPNSVER